MALFPITEITHVPRRSRRRRIGWGLIAAAGVGTLALSLLPTPYVIEQPGPVFDTLGEVTVDGESVTMISIPDEPTYETAGTLDMLTVNVLGNRESTPNWLEVVGAWTDPSRAVLPIDEVFPEGETTEQSNQQSALDMTNSQREAIAASLRELGYEFSSSLTVAAVSPGYPAAGVIEPGDVIVSVDGEDPADVSEMRAIIAEHGIDSPVPVVVQRGGVDTELDITAVMSEGEAPAPILGVQVGAEYDFPFEIDIQLDDVGGPSAGMMFALGIIDKLTPGELNGGENVAGTGTISADGTVGPIGGIRQKLYGARDAGATHFLAPAANCDEVVGHVPDGLEVFRIETLDDALAVMTALESGSGTAGLSTCTAP